MIDTGAELSLIITEPANLGSRRSALEPNRSVSRSPSRELLSELYLKDWMFFALFENWIMVFAQGGAFLIPGDFLPSRRAALR